MALPIALLSESVEYTNLVIRISNWKGEQLDGRVIETTKIESGSDITTSMQAARPRHQILETG